MDTTLLENIAKRYYNVQNELRDQATMLIEEMINAAKGNRLELNDDYDVSISYSDQNGYFDYSKVLEVYKEDGEIYLKVENADDGYCVDGYSLEHVIADDMVLLVRAMKYAMEHIDD